MKKKIISIVIVIVIIFTGVSAWFYFYNHHKNIDNIPSLELMVTCLQEKGEDYASDKIAGYTMDELSQVWGEPATGLFGMYGYVWGTEDENITVYFNSENHATGVKLNKEDSSEEADITQAGEENLSIQEDTTVVQEDTFDVHEDTFDVQEDTSVAQEDTLDVQEDTSVVQEDASGVAKVYDTWQEAYLEIICNMQNYLSGNPDDIEYRNDPDIYNPMDNQVYLGIHDFDSDEIPELLVGDILTMAVFTFREGRPEKIEDLYYRDRVWCINGVYFKDNSISLTCVGSGGSDYVNFGYLDGEYLLGTYPKEGDEPRINGKMCSADEVNRIYTINFEERQDEERRERLKLVNEDGVWILRFPSGDEAVLNENFDYGLIEW